MTLRLVKIAKELNVGTSTIVDYLNSHGFEIEDKPSAKVTDEMHNILIKEFYKDRDIKEQADQLIIGNRPLTKKDTPPQPVVSKIEKPAPKEEVVKQTDATPSSEVKKEEVIEERPRLLKSTLKILGKIDLDNKKGKPEPKPIEESKVEQKPQEKAEVEPQAEKQAPIEASKSAAETPPKVEQEQKEKEKQEEKTPEKPVAPKVEAKTDEKPAAQDVPAEKESNGEEKPAGQEYFRAEAPELRGLKILGKIDTDKFKKPQKKKEKEVRDNRDNKNRDNRDNRDNRGGDNKDRDKPKTEVASDGKDKNKPAVPGDDKNRNRQGGTPQNNNNSEDARKKRKRKRKKITTATEGGGERRGGDNRDNNNNNNKTEVAVEIAEVVEMIETATIAADLNAMILKKYRKNK
ncbi:MAG: hypothetical protein IPJ74_11965 [Saprospiraceae bacterium]|nr:hypothetical protein [Saprospiraceae bacterium]